MQTTQKGAIAGVTGIGLGIMTMLGGVDIPTFTILMALWAFIIAIKYNAFADVIKGIAKRPLSTFFVLIAIIYMIMTRLHETEIINSTAKTFIIGAIFLPFLSWAMMQGNDEDRKIATRGLIAGFVMAMLLLCYEAFSGYQLYHLATPHQDPKEMERNLGRGVVVLIVLFWSVLLAIDSQKLDIRVKIGVIIGTIFLSTRFGIDLNMLMIAIAAAAYFTALLFPRLALSVVVGVAALLVGSAPWFYGFLAKWTEANFKGHLPLSYQRRADMWLYAIDRIKEKPIFGWDLDAAKNFNDVVWLGGYQWVAIQQHPHSAPVHIWLEGGVVGAALFVLVILVSGVWLVRAGGRDRRIAAALAGGLTSVIIAWAFTYGAWQQWLWMAMFFAVIYPFLIDLPPQKPKSNKMEFEEIA